MNFLFDVSNKTITQHIEDQFMKMILFFLAFFPCSLSAQTNNGIKFQENLSWKQLQKKAKKENKYIFLDCYATWCMPCKKMDKEVYPDKQVGDFMNKTFISVKVQMDSLKNDDKHIKAWYADAKNILKKYGVQELPTFLFFSPDGKIVHRASAFKESAAFIELVKNAADTNKQYYTQLNNYLKGTRDYSGMPYLVEMTRSLGDRKLAKDIAREYINNYLMNLPDNKLYTKDNIRFIGSYVNSKDTPAFNLFYNTGRRIDSLMNDGENTHYSRRVIEWIISNEEIYPYLWENNDFTKPVTKSPDWQAIASRIQNKYGNGYVERSVLNAKILWFENRKQWEELIKVDLEKIEKYGLDTFGTMGKVRINNMAWYHIFLHADDTSILNKVSNLMEPLIKAEYLKSDALYPTLLDTYANLLYKAGKIKEAISIEKEALSLDPDNKDINEAYQKMQKGLPTW